MAGEGAGAEIPSAGVATRKRRLSAVWIIPVLAALVGAWVAVTRILDKGPEITIEFRTGEGLEAGKTKIKYKGVEIGVLTEVRLIDDLRVQGTAEMEPGSEKLLLEDSRVWVVRPRVKGASISGLGTLVSGSYIAIDLGTSDTHGGKERRFKALSAPPVVYSDAAGTFFTLTTASLGSLDSGTPVYYRKLEVGQVASYELDKDGQAFNVRVYVEAPYDAYVKQTSRFWHAGGVDFSLSAAGLSIQTQSLLSVLIGGIAFESPAEDTAPVQAVENAVFPLYDNRTAAFRPPAQDPHTYKLVFNGSVRGLAPGAPVEFRGIPIGEVESVGAELDETTYEFSAPVTVRIDLGRLGFKVKSDGASPDDEEAERRRLIDNLVSHDVRAQLRSGSLLTGALYVALETFPKTEEATVDWSQSPPHFPTVPGQLDIIGESLNRIVAKIDSIPLDAISADLRKTFGEVDRTLVSMRGTMDSATLTLDNTGKLVAPNSSLQSEISVTLQSVNDAARSIRVLADYLERHPESLLRGKTGDAK